MTEKPYGQVLDEMDHEAKYMPSPDIRRQEELRIQALGAAVSRRDWHAAERAYEAIRDEFDKRSAKPEVRQFKNSAGKVRELEMKPDLRWSRCHPPRP